MSVAAIYELETPFTEADLFSLNFEQAADLMTVSKMGLPFRRLRRFGHNNWILDEVPVGPRLTPPADVGVVAVNPKSGDSDYVATVKYYVVTAVSEDGQESQPSAAASAFNDLNLKGDYNTVTWTAEAGMSYKVYERREGMYGYLGTVRGGASSFKDDNILGNFADGPPQSYNPFATETPDIVGFHESRIVYGRFLTRPNLFGFSRTDDVFNFDRSTPTRATDSFSFALRSRKQNTIRHFVALKDLIILTNDAIWSMRSTADGVISPSTIKVVPEDYQGCGVAKPEVVGDKYFYTRPRGDSIRTGGYTFERDGYRGNNICVFASHLFSRFEVLEMSWSETPASALICRSNDGDLRVLTWMEEQDVWGWSLWQTQGFVESICTVPEDGRDALYAVIRRNINGTEERYVERMARTDWIDEGWNDHAGAICVDCAEYMESDTPFVSISGLDWLEGCDVVCLGDGVVYRDHRVENGTLVPPLRDPVKRLVVGLPYDAYIQTLPFITQTNSGSTKGRKASINNVLIDFINSGGFGYGLLVGANLKPDEMPELSVNVPVDEETETPPDIFTGSLDTAVEDGDYDEASVTIWQTDPLPFVVASIHFDIQVN